MPSVPDEIAKLFELYKAGAITREQFDEQRDRLLAEPPHQTPSTASDPAIPGEVGAYRLLELIGEGGMGAVYRGRHRSQTLADRQGGDVAIKVMHAQYARNPEYRARFEREAALGLKLVHPGIVRVHDLVVDGGNLALVLDHVQGRPLSEFVGEAVGPIPWDRAWPLFHKLLDAVGYAHEQGVVHRDLKPDNILVTPDGEPHVIDFGIAKDVDSGQTRTGTGMGTVEYMAPEQYTDAKAVDRRADIYSLGMILYEMLAGRLPWEVGAPQFEILEQKARRQLMSPLAFCPDIPEVVVAALAPALSASAEDRPATAAEFSRALERAGTTAMASGGATPAPAGTPSAPVREPKAPTRVAPVRPPQAPVAAPGRPRVSSEPRGSLNVPLLALVVVLGGGFLALGAITVGVLVTSGDSSEEDPSGTAERAAEARAEEEAREEERRAREAEEAAERERAEEEERRKSTIVVVRDASLHQVDLRTGLATPTGLGTVEAAHQDSNGNWWMVRRSGARRQLVWVPADLDLDGLVEIADGVPAGVGGIRVSLPGTSGPSQVRFQGFAARREAADACGAWSDGYLCDEGMGWVERPGFNHTLGESRMRALGIEAPRKTPEPEIGRVTLPAAFGRFECTCWGEDGDCGRSVELGALGWQLVLVEVSCGDLYHPGCLAYDPASGRYSTFNVETLQSGLQWQSPASAGNASKCGPFWMSDDNRWLGDGIDTFCDMSGRRPECRKVDGLFLGALDGPFEEVGF